MIKTKICIQSINFIINIKINKKRKTCCLNYNNKFLIKIENYPRLLILPYKFIIILLTIVISIKKQLKK